MSRTRPAELGGLHRALGARRQGRALLAAGGAQPAAQAGSSWYQAVRHKTDRRCLAAMAAPSGCSGSWPSMPTVSRRRSASGSASRRSCRSRWSSAPGSAMPAPTPAVAQAMGMKPEEFVARFGASISPREFGEKVVSVLDDPKYADGFGFRAQGRHGSSSNARGSSGLSAGRPLAESVRRAELLRAVRRAAARLASLLRPPHGIGHRRRGRRARHSRPGFRWGVARSGDSAAASTLAIPDCS